jgi:hypothetical protein
MASPAQPISKPESARNPAALVTLEARGLLLRDVTVRGIDDLLSDVALSLVNSVAARRRVSPHHLALAVSGLCHSHGPCRDLVAGCAYCRRRGNCFLA